MLQTTDKYKEFISKNGRTFYLKIIINDKEYTNILDFNLNDGTEADNSLSFGSTYSKSLTFSIPYVKEIFFKQKATVYIGLKTDQKEQWIKKSTLIVSKSTKSEELLEIECCDNFYLCEVVFFSELSGNQKIKSIIDEQCTKLGIEYINDIEDVYFNVDLLQGLTVREAFGYLAAYCGKNAIFDNEGRLKFTFYGDSIKTITNDSYKSPLKINEDDTIIRSLTCITKEKITDEDGTVDYVDKTLTVGEGYGITFSCLGMTQERLNILFDRINGFTYRAVEVNLLKGYPELEAGDTITLIDSDNKSYNVPIMEITSQCDGGYQSTIRSKTSDEHEEQFKGSLSKQVERNYQELGVFKEVTAEKFKGITAEFQNVNTDILNVNKELTAVKGTIEDLDVTKLSVKVAEIEEAYIDEAKLNTFVAQKGYLDEAQVNTLITQKGYLDEANINSLLLNKGYATELYIETNYAKKQYVDENYVGVQYADETYATKSTIEELEVDLEKVNTLLAGSVSAGSTQTIVLNAQNTTIANALIKDQMVDSLSFNKITGIDINTTKLTVHSDDGKSTWKDNTIQIKDSNRTRVQIGKDSQGDYNIYIWDKNGNVMFDPLGLTDKGVTREVIDNDNVKQNAGIKGSKLDIDSVVTEINNGSTTIKSSKIYFNEENQTLDVLFNSMTEKVDNIQVGGRNLILGSMTAVEGDLIRGSGTLEDAEGLYPNMKGVWTNTAWTERCVNLKAIAARGGFQVGDHLVISVYIKADSDFVTNVTCHRTRGTGNIEGSSKRYVNVTITNKWVQYWFPFIADEGSLNRDDARIEVHTSSGNNRIHWAGWKLEKGNMPTDYSVAPEDFQSQIETNTTAISVANGQISSLITRTSQVETNLGTANGKISTLQTNYNQVKSTVDTHTQTIGEHTTQIKNKADGSTVTAISNKVNSVEENINGFKRTVSDTYATKVDFNNLQIGGRNLFRGYDDSEIKLSNYQSTGSFSQFYDRLTFDPATTVGQIYTISLWARSPNGTTALQIYNQNGNPRYFYFNKTLTSSLGTEWQYFTYTFKNTDRGSSYTYIVNRIEIYAPSKMGVLVKKIKVEIGNKATDWTPAPEDTANEISTMKSSIEQNADSIKLKVSKNNIISEINQTSETVKISAGKIDLQGKVTISMLDNDVKTKVNNGNSAKSTLDSKATNWDNAYSWTSNNGSNMTNLRSMVMKWTNGAVSDSTTIQGGWIATNTITADKLVISDFTNYADLNEYTYAKYGFTKVADSSASNNPWFQRTSLTRDIAITDKAYTKYHVNGGEKFRIEYEVSSTVKGATSSGGATNTYMNINVGLYCKTATGASKWYCVGSAASDASGTVRKISTIATLDSDVRTFSVYVQIAGYPTFTGTLKIRNVRVTRMYGGELIVDGSITTEKLTTSNIQGTNGWINLRNGTFKYGNTTNGIEWTGSQLNVYGNITANSGTIAGWTIGTESVNGEPEKVIKSPTQTDGGGNTNVSYITSNGFVNRYVNPTADEYTHIEINGGAVDVLNTVKGTRVLPEGLLFYYSKKAIGATVYPSPMEYWAGISHDYSENSITIFSDGYIYLNATSGTILPNARYLCGTLTDGTNAHLIGVSSSNNVIINDLKHGNTNIYAGNKINLINPNSTIEFLGATGTNNGYFRPTVANKTTLGTSTYYFYRLYAGLAQWTPSDIRVKQNIKFYDERFEKMYMDLKPVTYELKDNPNQSHCGLIAQWTKQAMDRHGISEREFGVYEYDVESDNYGIVYPELTSLNMYMTQKAIKRIDTVEYKIDSHDDQLASLRNQYTELQNKYASLEAKYNQLLRVVNA